MDKWKWRKHAKIGVDVINELWFPEFLGTINNYGISSFSCNKSYLRTTLIVSSKTLLCEFRHEKEKMLQIKRHSHEILIDLLKKILNGVNITFKWNVEFQQYFYMRRLKDST